MIRTFGPHPFGARFARPGSFATGRTELSSCIGQDKIKKEGFSADSSQITGSFDNNLRSEALSALVMLGIKRSVAQKSIETVLRNSENNITLELLIKLSLQAS